MAYYIKGSSMLDSLIIVSGGMDSITLLYHIVKTEKRQPAVLSFQYGQKHLREIECAQFHVRELEISIHKVIDLNPIQDIFNSSSLVGDLYLPSLDEVQGDSQPSTYVPNRNMLFLSIAAAWAENLGISTIFYGAQRHDLYGYWDTTTDFLEKMNAVLGLNRKNKVEIHAPFVNLSKADILQLGMKLGVDYAHTWSCYAGQEKACGHCPTCGERLAAFTEIGKSDPIPYSLEG
jgi:7-cyano-7-deazaguanine synthase